MSKTIVKSEDVVGTYERVYVVHCDSCGKDTIRVCQIAENPQWMTDFNPHVPWICTYCDAEDYSPDSHYAKRFICPSCRWENVQILEPTRIDYQEGKQFICYSTTRMTCMYCETEFGLCVFMDNPATPNTWVNALYRLTAPENSSH